MLVSKRRLLAVVGIGIPFLVGIVVLAVWGFQAEISTVLLDSVSFPLIKPIMALGTFLVGCFMAFSFSLIPPLPQQKQRLFRFLKLVWIGFPLLMMFWNSLAVMFAADRLSLAFTISAWSALACLVAYFPAIVASSLVYASQRRAADLVPRGEAV